MNKKITSFAFFVISDFAVIFISFTLAFLIRKDILPNLFLEYKNIPLYPLSNFLSRYFFIVIWFFIYAYKKLYTKRFPFWEEIKNLFAGATLSSALIIIIIFLTKTQVQFSRTIVILAWLISLILFPLMRYITKLALLKMNIWKKKLIIIGANESSFIIIKNIRKNKTLGYEILGFLENNPQKVGKVYHGVKVIGLISQLEEITKSLKSKDIIIAMPDLPTIELKRLIKKCDLISDSMWIAPRVGELISTGVEIELIGQILVLNIKKNLSKPWNIIIKSIFDLLFSIISIIVLLPIFCITAIAIKMDSKGPIIFMQKRIGFRKKPFNLFKFRSMYLNSDEKLIDYFKSNQKAKEEWEKYKKIKGYDPRVTKIGQIIRKYSIDEFPQLFNVLQRKMSLVGPRPYLPEELKENHSFKKIIARVKPGITGLWQVSGRNKLPFDERILLDEYYIRNWSLWLDITIFLKSIKVFISKEGAY